MVVVVVVDVEIAPGVEFDELGRFLDKLEEFIG